MSSPWIFKSLHPRLYSLPKEPLSPDSVPLVPPLIFNSLPHHLLIIFGNFLTSLAVPQLTA